MDERAGSDPRRAVTAGPRRAVTARDLFALQFVSDARVSPDGKRVAFVATEFDLERNGYRARVWMTDVPGAGGDATAPAREFGAGTPARARPFTSGLGANGPCRDQTPRWSPDGRRLAFLSDRGGKDHLWLIPADGGEPAQLTFGDDAVSMPAWSQDGRRIAFVARPPRQEPDVRATAHKADVRVITRLRHKLNGVGFVDERPKQVWVVDVECETVWQVTEGPYDCADPVWSPGGDRIAFSSCRNSDGDLVNIPDIWGVPANGGTLERLTPGLGLSGRPEWSPDGRRIAYLGHDRGESGAANTDVWVVDLPAHRPANRLVEALSLDPSDGRGVGVRVAVDADVPSPRCLTTHFDRSAGNHVGADARYERANPGVTWSADGRFLWCLATDGGDCRVYRVEVDTGRVTAVTAPGGVVTSYSVASGGAGAGGTAAVVTCCMADPLNPGDVWVLRDDGASHDGANTVAWRLTAVNDAVLSELDLQPPERIEVTGPGGVPPVAPRSGVKLGEPASSLPGPTPIEGWIIKPRGFEPGKRHPLILYIHGGPHAAYGNAFMHEFQLLAARGYGVLFCNPRGSHGYGEAFTQAVIGNWGGLDYADLMAAVDHALGLGWVDPHRIGVAGGSYGGFAVNWIVGHTERFAAAVSERSVSNMYTKYGTSDIGFHGNRRGMGGADLWDDEEFLMASSPIRYAPRVRTPTLIIHSDQDLRCPIEQGEQWYTALRRLGVITEFVRFSGENHELSRSGKPFNRLERLQRIAAWFERFIPPGSA